MPTLFESYLVAAESYSCDSVKDCVSTLMIKFVQMIFQ